MKNWKKLYVRFINTTDILDRVKEDLDFIDYLAQENIVWRNPLQAEMPYIAEHRRYLVYVDTEQFVFLKLKCGL